MLGEIRRFLRQNKDYFANNLADIEAETLRVLRVSCLLYAAILILFTAQTYFMRTSELLLKMYLVYDAIHLGLCLCVFWKGGRQLAHTRVHALKVVMEISVLSFFVLEAVFPFPDQQCLYYPFPLLLMIVVYPYRVSKAATLILGYTVSFVTLQLIF